MNQRAQKVIINLKRVPKGYTVVESSVDAATVISFPKNVVYGNVHLRRGRHPLNRSINEREQKGANNYSSQPTRPERQINQTVLAVEQKNFKIQNNHQKINNGQTISAYVDQDRKLISADILNQAFQRPENKPSKVEVDVAQDIQPQVKQVPNYKEQFLKQFNNALPTTTRWFSQNGVHAIEKDALPEFFNESQVDASVQKNARLYLKHRNSIIERWHKNPKYHLKLTECILNMPGDASAISRIYAFLEHWGLINFQVSSNQIGTGSYIQKNQNFWERFKLIPNAEEQAPLPQSSLHQCTICSESSNSVWQQMEDTQANFQDFLFTLCKDCYAQKLYPSYLNSEDFVELQKSDGQVEQKWTDEENLRLLELIYKYQENWSEIKKHFVNKTVENIIHQYLRLPFLNLSEVSIIDDTELHPDTQKTQALTFAEDECNPLLKYVAVFKICLDRVDKKDSSSKREEYSVKSTENNQMLGQMIENQLKMMDRNLNFLEELEKNIHQEKLQLNDIKRQNTEMLLEKNDFSEHYQ